MPDPRDAYDAALREAVRHGLRSDGLPARAHAWATYWMAVWGWPEPARPDITSGYRSPARQRELLRRWAAGDRAGFIGRPATRSWHTVRRAWDVQTRVRGYDVYEYLMRWLSEQPGVRIRVGVDFDDQGHFDAPTDTTPPSVYTL